MIRSISSFFPGYPVPPVGTVSGWAPKGISCTQADTVSASWSVLVSRNSVISSGSVTGTDNLINLSTCGFPVEILF